MRLPRFTSLVLTALLAARGSAPTTVGTTTQAASSTPEAVEAYREARDVDCQAAGGTLQRLGRLQREQCVIPYADAGRACSRKATARASAWPQARQWPVMRRPVPASVMPARTSVAASVSMTARRRVRSAWIEDVL